MKLRILSQNTFRGRKAEDHRRIGSQILLEDQVVRPCSDARTRATGSTSEFAFILPKPANASNTRPHKRKAARPSHKTRAATAGRKTAAKPTRPRLTEEQKR